MEWYKHKSNTAKSDETRYIIKHCGIAGYGVYMLLLDYIAENNGVYELKPFIRTLLINELSIDDAMLQLVLNTAVECELLQINGNTITCPNILGQIRLYDAQAEARSAKASKAAKAKWENNPNPKPIDAIVKVPKENLPIPATNNVRMATDKQISMLKARGYKGSMTNLTHDDVQSIMTKLGTQQGNIITEPFDYSKL